MVDSSCLLFQTDYSDHGIVVSQKLHCYILTFVWIPYLDLHGTLYMIVHDSSLIWNNHAHTNLLTDSLWSLNTIKKNPKA